MCQDKFERRQIKMGSGVPTIPVSTDHRNGDWIATDIYDGELYMDTDTGLTYTRNGSVIQMSDGRKAQKTWKALITQTGTSAPVLTVVENSLGVTITPAYVSAGIYTLSGFAGNLVINQCDIHNSYNHIGDQWQMQLQASTDSVLTIGTYEVGTGYINNALVDVGNSITINVY